MASRDKALAAHLEGSFGEAEALYREALKSNPDDVDVLHMLGVLKMQRLRYQEAFDLLFESAQRVDWESTLIRHNLGLLCAKLLTGEANLRQEEVLAEFVEWERDNSLSCSGHSPLVTVVLPSYNHADYIAQAIRSVDCQTYAPIELIIIDDGSTDSSREAIERCLRDVSIPSRFIARENRGAHATLNEGADLARGEYLAFLNSDDFYGPDRIARMVDEIVRPGLKWGYSQVEYVGANGSFPADAIPEMAKIYRDRYRALIGRHSNSIALVEYNLATSTGNIFIERELFHRVGGFRDLRYNHDWDFCLRASALAEPKLVRSPLYYYRVHCSNTISESQVKAQREANAVFREFLSGAMAATRACLNPLAPQCPDNRIVLLKQILGSGRGALLPVEVLRSLTNRFRAERRDRGTSAPASLSGLDRSRTAVVVLGMHRSGTSALARVLNLCGAYLPANLRPPKLGSNAKGFWEAEQVIELNDRILAKLGGSWNRVEFDLPVSGGLVDDFLSDAQTLLVSEYGMQDPILIKDPRIGVLAPLWHRALIASGYRPVYVVPVRNPLEVARSLHARGDMSVQDGLQLWSDYSSRIEMFVQTLPDVIHVRFTDLLGNWRAVVRHIADRLDVPLDVWLHAQEVDRFLEPGLRHQAVNETDLDSHEGDQAVGAMHAHYQMLEGRCASHNISDKPAAPELPATASFVLCIEDNAIREQALLLCESIRRFGGRHRDAPILAFSPRPGMGIDSQTRLRLDSLRVRYLDLPLNTDCPEYGSANRVFAAAWAEAHCDTDFVVVLDSDTVFLGEPVMPVGTDIAVRPVDAKGSATSGPGDCFEGYWKGLADLCGASLDRLPFVQTTIGGERIRASYNGGLIIARRQSGLLGRWAELFRRSVRLGMKPYRDSSMDILASTGYVGNKAAKYWGSNQAALAVAIWANTDRVSHLGAAYNLPLHQLAGSGEIAECWLAEAPVHVHYHWMFTPEHRAEAMRVLARLGVAADCQAWLARRTPLSS